MHGPRAGSASGQGHAKRAGIPRLRGASGADARVRRTRRARSRRFRRETIVKKRTFPVELAPGRSRIVFYLESSLPFRSFSLNQESIKHSIKRKSRVARVLDTVPATDWTPDAHYVSPIMRERAYAPSSIESAPRSESVSKSESEPVGSQSSTSSPAPQRKPSTSTSVAPSATSTARS